MSAKTYRKINITKLVLTNIGFNVLKDVLMIMMMTTMMMMMMMIVIILETIFFLSIYKLQSFLFSLSFVEPLFYLALFDIN